MEHKSEKTNLIPSFCQSTGHFPQTHTPLSFTQRSKTCTHQQTKLCSLNRNNKEGSWFCPNSTPPPTMAWIRAVKSSRLSALCQKDETTLAALSSWQHMRAHTVQTHCKSSHGGTCTSSRSHTNKQWLKARS